MTRAFQVGLTLVIASFVLMQASQANDILMQYLQDYCIDCHGSPDEEPEGGFSLLPIVDGAPLDQVGPILKDTLDAVEGFEMPPSDVFQPTDSERIAMAKMLHQRLAIPTLDDQFDPGQPVLRRLTRLEYNNTVRDLLGLQTDVFIFSERLPFSRNHYRPTSDQMPDRVVMTAREYGAKYPVFLTDASMSGDSRAEYGFTNRGDAQSMSAVGLKQYIDLAGKIAFHPELLSQAQRMEELFPNAKFSEARPKRPHHPQPTVAAVSQLATNDNVRRDDALNHHTFDGFRDRLASAFIENRGGVLDGETLGNTTIAGKGGLIHVAYGLTADRWLAINPNEDIWFAGFSSAKASSGGIVFANKQKQKRAFELTFQASKVHPFSGVAEIGLVLLSRRNQRGAINVRAILDDGNEEVRSISLLPGAGLDNTFVAFKAGQGRSIRRLAIDGKDFSGDYVVVDDLALITHDPPDAKALTQIEKRVEVPTTEIENRLAIDASISQQSIRRRLQHFLPIAFRRQVSVREIDTYLSVYRVAIESGHDEEFAMRRTLQAVLCSPSFLYLNFQNQKQTIHDTAADQGAVIPLSHSALATRLSYFLWNTMPDQALMRIASEGLLQDDEVLEAQAQRMLKDPRSIELIEDFFVQWLRMQELWSAQPDQDQFPTFYSAANNKRTLAQDMFGEMLLRLQTLLIEDRPITDLIRSDDQFINGKLLSVFQCDADQLVTCGGQPLSHSDLRDDRVWYRVQSFDPQRSGILTSPAMLTLTSYPHRTSSIRRGVWILDTLLNRHPPAPKVAVADIDEQASDEGLSLREKVERHRAESACAVCHDRIDPPGFALENFDAIGRWRDRDGDEVIDAAGELRGFGRFQDPAQFQTLVINQKSHFVRGFVEHLLSYALSRQLEFYDSPTVDRIMSKTRRTNHRLSSIIVQIVKSHPFRHARVSHD